MFKKTCKNIENLRKCYGETQKQLAESIKIAESYLSELLHEKKQFSFQTLKLIADHYNLSIDELVGEDITEYFSFHAESLEFDKLFKMQTIMFPIFKMKNPDSKFQNGYKIITQAEEDFNKNPLSPYRTERLYSALDSFAESYEKKQADEALANILWIIFTIYCAWPDEYNERLGKAIYFRKNNSKSFMREYFANKENALSEKTKADKGDYVRELRSSIIGFISILKDSEQYKELAEFYLALGYLIGLLSSGHNNRVNRIIGIEMMNLNLEFGNEYTMNFFDFLFNNFN